MISLKNKKVVVVGASSGIGRALSKMFSVEGAIVYLISRTREKLGKVQKELSGVSSIHTMDMLDDVAVEKVFEEIGAFDFLTFTAVSDKTKLMSPIKSMTNETAQRGMEKF